MVEGDRSFERRLPAAVRSLAELRSDLREWLAGTAVESARRTDVVLAASELAAAAIRAVPERDADVAVRAWLDDRDIVVESCARVSDHAVMGGPSSISGAFEGNDGERGFSIVAALSDVFAVKGLPSGVVVRARMAPRRFGPSTTG